MNNDEQILEIQRYWKHLCNVKGKQIDLEMAASLWVDKYAGLWREKKPFQVQKKINH